jgi:PDZ domain-containing protein
MVKALLLLSAVAATSVAATLSAQGTKATPDSNCTNYPDGRVECKIVRRSGAGDSALHKRITYRMDSLMAKRAALGIELRATGTKRDTLGVFVAAVTPKGPAESAGIIEGDRIAAINGVDLRTAAGDTDDSYANGLAAHRLSREVQKLTPGNRVNLRVYSSGRFRDVQVTAGKASDVMRLGGRFNFRVPGPDKMMEFGGPGGATMFGPEMPMLRKQLDHLPDMIQLRTPMRFRTMAPMRARVLKIDADGKGADESAAMPDEDSIFLDGEPVMLDMEGPFMPDEEPFILDTDDNLFDIESDIEQVPPDVIRELAANAIRDAQSALKQLAADGVV